MNTLISFLIHASSVVFATLWVAGQGWAYAALLTYLWVYVLLVGIMALAWYVAKDAFIEATTKRKVKPETLEPDFTLNMASSAGLAACVGAALVMLNPYVGLLASVAVFSKVYLLLNVRKLQEILRNGK